MLTKRFSLEELYKLNRNLESGFTLIELLVVVIIVAILSAIALPSYLNQAMKARSTEAKASLGQINRAQQAYRVEQGTFADTLSKIDGNTSGKYFSFSISNGTANFASASAIRINNDSVSSDLPSYSSAIALRSDSTFKYLLCTTTSPSDTPPSVQNVNGCPNNSEEVK